MANEQPDLLKLNAKLVAYLGRHEARDKLCRSNTRRKHLAQRSLHNEGFRL
jgi:hypothetical protein